MAHRHLKLLKLKTTLIIIFFFFLFLILILIPVLVLSDNKDQRDYMLKLMRGITPTPSNWSHTTDMCSWSRVYCDTGLVDRIDLSSMSLRGTIPSGLNDSLFSLTKIETLSSMTQLTYVELAGNRFEGPIPDLSNCSQLQRLNLEDNQLTGVVPPSLMNLSRLFKVSLDNNWLQGPLPVFNKSVSNVSVLGNSFCLEHAGPCDERVNTLLQIAAAFGYPLLLARSWRANHPCHGWRFITCDDGGSIITTLNLTKLNLTGTISDAFPNLTGLHKLYLTNLRFADFIIVFHTLFLFLTCLVSNLTFHMQQASSSNPVSTSFKI